MKHTFKCMKRFWAFYFPSLLSAFVGKVTEFHFSPRASICHANSGGDTSIHSPLTSLAFWQSRMSYLGSSMAKRNTHQVICSQTLRLELSQKCSVNLELMAEPQMHIQQLTSGFSWTWMTRRMSETIWNKPDTKVQVCFFPLSQGISLQF